MVLLLNADVYAPLSLGIRHLLIGGGRIVWLGPDAQLPDLPGALLAQTQSIDLEGRRLIPGLIDGHVHVTGGGGEAGFATRVPPVGLSRFTGAGVTTVVGLLGTDDVARGPRELLATLYGLREQGLNAYGYTGGYHVPPATLTGSVKGDVTFIEALIGVGEVAISDHRSSQPTYEELLRLASEAHLAGLLTGKAGIVHLHLGDGPRGLEFVRRARSESELPARVFHPTHVNRRRALYVEALELARDGVTIDVTAFAVEDGEDAFSAADALALYFASDAPAEQIAISSDAGGCLPCFDPDGRVTHMDVGDSGELLKTLSELCRRGVPLERALAPFTSNPARQLRLSRKGGIAQGLDADLVALEATGEPHTVIINGDLYVRDGQAVRRGRFERPAAGGLSNACRA